MRSEQGTVPVKLARKRQFLLVLPLFVFPFLTLMLWSLGVLGGKEKKAVAVTGKGFNMNLPDARPVKDNDWNKLRFYEQADKDSAKYQSLLRSDPYLQLAPADKAGFKDTGAIARFSATQLSYDPYPAAASGQHHDANEEKVYKKLAELNHELHKAESRDTDSNRLAPANFTGKEMSGSPDMERLESLMQGLNSTEGTDPQLNQLSGMLEKILDIQHPDRVKDRLQEQSERNKTQVFPVSVKKEGVAISLLQGKFGDNGGKTADSGKETVPVAAGFYSLDDGQAEATRQSAIRAIIPVTQTIVSGATIKLRMLDEVYIGGMLIPKDTYVFGQTALNGERLSIDIATIRFGNNILPVALSVFDLDGLEGIYMPGAITRDVAKQSTDQAIQSLSIASLDPSLGAQAASAGIQAAKSLIGKKAKMVKVTVKTGYEVLLRDNNRQQ